MEQGKCLTQKRFLGLSNVKVEMTYSYTSQQIQSEGFKTLGRRTSSSIDVEEGVRTTSS